MASNNLPQKLTTYEVMHERFKALRKHLVRRRAWLAVGFTVAVLIGGILGDDDSRGVNLTYTIFMSVLFCLFTWATISDNVNQAKFEATARKLDEVLEAWGGRWERCEESADGWAIHSGTDPHGVTEESEDAEEAEK